ncbi:MAG: PEP-CTERM sorting domain-containing protein [Phycisphaerae bacterium]|nr:PEP-CTERM sorting domain-containing protein [Phycisphaerae bacterium]
MGRRTRSADLESRHHRREQPRPPPFLTADETSPSWSFTFDVPAGTILDYDFTYDALLFEAPNGTYDLFVDLDLGAMAKAPEPASMIILCGGAVSLVLRKRRRKN